MKKFISLILSALLVFAAMPAAMANASSVMPEDYSYVIWSENFTGDTSADITKGFTKQTLGAAIETYASQNAYAAISYDKSIFSTLDSSTKNAFVRVRYGSATAPVQSSGKSVEELSKMQVSFDIIATTGSQISIPFRDKFSNSSSAKTDYLIGMRTDGTITFMNSASTYQYNTGDHLSFDVFFNFTGEAGTYSVYINEQEVISNASTDNLTHCVESFGVETSIQEATDSFSFGLDNIRFAIPEPCGYEYVITEHRFDDLTAGTDIPLTYKLTATAPSEVKIVADSDGVHGNCLQFSGSGAAVGVGILKSTDWNYPTEAPKLVKLEMDLKRANDVAVYIFTQTPSGGTQNALMLWGGDKELKFNNNTGSTRKGSGIKVATNTWVTVEMYFNYTTSKYYVYIDGSYTGEYDIDTKNVANLETIYVSGNNQISVDNLKVSTIPACALPVISEYKTHGTGATSKLGFLAKNSETSEKTYNILLAKYNPDDTLASVTISDGSVAASATELEELTYPTPASDGSYYRYFVWNSMSDLVPLVEAKEIR